MTKLVVGFSSDMLEAYLWNAMKRPAITARIGRTRLMTKSNEATTLPKGGWFYLPIVVPRLFLFIHYAHPT